MNPWRSIVKWTLTISCFSTNHILSISWVKGPQALVWSCPNAHVNKTKQTIDVFDINPNFNVMKYKNFISRLSIYTIISFMYKTSLHSVKSTIMFRAWIDEHIILVNVPPKEKLDTLKDKSTLKSPDRGPTWIMMLFLHGIQGWYWYLHTTCF